MSAIDKLRARARGRKFLHIGLMLFWAILALATSAWFLILTAVHWALASLYEQFDPHLAQRIAEDRQRHRELLRQEHRSQHVIQTLKNEVFLRRYPWMAVVAAGLVSPMFIWRAFVSDNGKAYEKGLREGQELMSSISKGMFGPK